MNNHKNNPLKLMAVLCSFTVLASCTVISPRVIDTDETRASMDVIDEQSASDLADNNTSERTDGAEQEANGEPQKPAYSSLINVSAKNVSAKRFFASLVAGSKENMVIHPNVKGRISLDLKNIRIIDALKAVRDLYGYDFEISDYGIRILPKQIKTRVFPINYLNVAREGFSDMSVEAGKATSDENETTEYSNKISTHHKMAFWQSLEKTLKLIANSDKSATIVVDPSSSLVIVNAGAATVAHIQDYLEKAQLSATKQVQIEAKLIEVTLKDGFKTGIKWNALTDLNGNELSSILTTGGVSNPPQEGILSFAFKNDDFNGVMQALETQGDVNVLSSPRISTINNQKAVIKVGTDDFFVTGVKRENQSNDSQNGPEIELSRFFSGIALDVTPQIGEDEQIMIHVHPKVTDVVEKVKSIEVDDSDFELPLASSSVRETDSIVRAKSGQVIAIGGLMQNKTVDKESKVPLLGDIPILGYLFKQKEKQIIQSELVILIQPKIINQGLSFDEIERLNNRYDRTLIKKQARERDDEDDDR